MFYKGLYIFISVFCVCFTALLGNSRAGERIDEINILFHVEPSELESNLIYLIQTNGYTYKKNSRRQLEMYFDTPELFFLKNKFCLKYQAKEYLSKKNNKKYNEKIEFYTENDQFIYPVKHYKRAKSPEDKHPFLGMVKRKDRQTLIKGLQIAGVKYPLRLKKIFTVSKLINSYSIFNKNEQIGTITLGHVESTTQKNRVPFNEIRVDINRDKGNYERKTASDLYVIYYKLENLYDNTLSGIEFYGNNGKNDYPIIFQLLKEKIPFFHFELKYPSIIHFVYSALTTLIGLIIIKILFWNRFFSASA